MPVAMATEASAAALRLVRHGALRQCSLFSPAYSQSRNFFRTKHPSGVNRMTLDEFENALHGVVTGGIQLGHRSFRTGYLCEHADATVSGRREVLNISGQQQEEENRDHTPVYPLRNPGGKAGLWPAATLTLTLSQVRSSEIPVQDFLCPCGIRVRTSLCAAIDRQHQRHGHR